jgi:hypothetical protein
LTVDWDKPIEAVHEDGRVAGACLLKPDNRGWLALLCGWSCGVVASLDGSIVNSSWRIRNTPQQTRVQSGRQTIGDSDNLGDLGSRAQQTPTPDVVGNSFLVPKLTEAQARKWVATNAPGAKADGLLAFLAEHSALLPEPVDGDLVEAREVVVAMEDRPFYSWKIRSGEHDGSHLVQVALAAIRRGRALERGEA